MKILYNLSRWRKGRLLHLAEQPLCVVCKVRGILTIATVVDHDPPHRNDYDAFFDESTWRSLCKRCHDSVTSRADGGFGNKVKRDRTAPVIGCDVTGMPTDTNHFWKMK